MSTVRLEGTALAFDMYRGSGEREEIGRHEEFLFELAQASETKCPQLLRIWKSFFNDPSISAEQAGALVHELIDLLAVNGGASNKPLVNVVVRLLPFFSTAYRNQQEVRCQSD